ncbi:hypothetical protein C8R44DRAFT_122586 [Mycena epipterygia]|nr:hypothetical protein C8R44DRAFT_122586 [Mycena epipterygia]
MPAGMSNCQCRHASRSLGSLRGTLDRNPTPDLMRTSALGMVVRPFHSDIAYCFRRRFILRCRCGNVPSPAKCRAARGRLYCCPTRPGARAPQSGLRQIPQGFFRRSSMPDRKHPAPAMVGGWWGAISVQSRSRIQVVPWWNEPPRLRMGWGGPREGRGEKTGALQARSRKREKGDLDSRDCELPVCGEPRKDQPPSSSSK